VDSCSHCGGPLPEAATFCPSCGRRTDAPPPAAREVPIDVQHAEPRYFGLAAPDVVFSAAIVLAAVGIALLVAGYLAVGLIAVVLAICLLPAFLAGARRWPDSPLARLGIGTADRVRDEAGVAVESISAWSRAGRYVARLRKEQFGLRRERDARIRRLGVSFYSDDGQADTLKAEAKALDDRMEANQRELQRAVAGARRQTRKGRATVAATEVIEPGPEVSPAPEQESPPVTELTAEPPAEDAPLTRAEEVDGEPKPAPSKKRQARSR
jgi:hypothetical protein